MGVGQAQNSVRPSGLVSDLGFLGAVKYEMNGLKLIKQYCGGLTLYLIYLIISIQSSNMRLNIGSYRGS